MVSFFPKFMVHDEFDFDIVNFPFLDGDIPRAPSHGEFLIIAYLFTLHISTYSVC